MRVFVFGMGYSSLAAARAIRTICGADVLIDGTTRSADKVKTLSLAGVTAHLFDGETMNDAAMTALSSATHVIHSIAPDGQGDAVVKCFARALAASDALEWMGYFSTVGVYGNFDGGWIDETASCKPENQRSQWRVATEQQWRGFAANKGIPLTVLRLAGIYGPGRSTFDKLASGTSNRIIKQGQVFNRIHVDDIGRITALAARMKLDGTYNLADDEPAPPQDVIVYAADMMGIAPPPAKAFEQADMSPMARSFYADNKRVSNAAIKRALGIELLYPTYRDGLNMIRNGQ